MILNQRLIHTMFPICSKIAGRRIEKSVTIMDLKGVSIMSLFFGKVKTFTKIATKIAQDYYPEILGQMFIVNSGFMFRGIWGMVSVWIDKKTKKKINIISGSGKKNLLKAIDADKLPVFLGGTCEIGLRESPGPWKEEILKSYGRKSVQIEDQSIVLKYYRTPEEIKELESKKEETKEEPKEPNDDLAE